MSTIPSNSTVSFRADVPLSSPRQATGGHAAIPSVPAGPNRLTGGMPPGRVARQQRRLRERQAAKNPAGGKGDPAGNFVQSVVDAGRHAGQLAASIIPGTAHLNLLAQSAVESLSSAGDHLWNACGDAGTLVWDALEGAGAAVNFQVGPAGAEGAAIEAPGQCRPDGTGKCADTVAPPSLSQVSLAKFKEAVGKDFKVTESKSLKGRADRTMSNVMTIIIDSEHYNAKMQEMINNVLVKSYETGDKLFAEARADEPPSPAFCRGVPPADCAGIDDAGESQRLTAMASEASKLAKEALAIMAKYAPKGVKVPLDTNSYGSTKRAFLAAYESVRTGRIPIPGSKKKDVADLQKLVSLHDKADSAFMKAVASPESHAIRDSHMSQSIVDAAAALGGRKGYAVIGWDHYSEVKKQVDKAGIDCIYLVQKTLTDLPPFSDEGLRK